MIFYFSATGNCRMVAKIIANNTHEETISITDCMKQNRFDFSINKGENIGFVTPTYYWGLPSIVVDFVNRLTLDGGVDYCYHVATYGTTTGQSSRQMRELLSQKHIVMNASFSVKMVDTWTPTFDLSDPEKNRCITEAAACEAQEVARQIAVKKCGDYAKAKVPMPLVRWYYAKYDKKSRTENFTLLDSCIGCGICARQCPADAIQIKDKEAVWVKEQCVMCLGCLHHCPKFAIQYGPNTKKHGQFVNSWTDQDIYSC